MTSGRIMSWKWYGVRTVYRSVPAGRPQGTDEDYAADVTLVEDRVVLIRARNFEEAIHKGEIEAKAYAAEALHRNPYGQPVQQRFLGYCDAYELWAEPGASIEIFSSTEIVAKSESDSRVIDRFIGSKESRKANRQRRNFFNIVFNRPARGVQTTEEERSWRERINRKLNRKTQV
jgi:hypothetical protein